MGWRQWVRRNIAGVVTEGKVRIAVRLPNGGRVVKMLEETATLTALYAYVDTHLIPTELMAQDDPSSPPEQGYGADGIETTIERRISAEGENADEWWGFRLVLAYPRTEVPWKVGMRVGQVECLRGGAQVVVEMLGTPGGRNSAGSLGAQDGYSTEDSE